MNTVVEQLKSLLADTYTLYLKTQNFHWHVKGPNFVELHELFEQQYTELATAIDDVAERIRMLGEIAPASFDDFTKFRTLKDGNALLASNDMLQMLHSDHQSLITNLNALLKLASENSDEGTVSLLSERIATHEKMAWMLSSSMA